MSNEHLTETRFDLLGLRPEILQGVEDTGFSHCTPIQAQTLPIALKGHDVAGQAQTGTGKTAAFLIATMQHLLETPPAPHRKPTQPRALILAPTRELAIQIHKDAETIGAHTGLSLGLVYGGTGYESQRKMLEDGIDILIGTPGRIIDYFKQHVFNLKAIQVVVMDEADRMFDLGFIKDIRYLLRHMPPPDQRLGLLFSATLSFRVTELAYEHMNNPERVEINPEEVTVDRINQCVYMTANSEKIPLLIGLLQHMDPRRTIVFVNTKRAAERVWAFLEGNGFNAALLSGDVPQTKRQRLLQRFHDGELSVLVGTDVAARGLHIPDVSHVFNFDLPQDPEDYVHRIGRTARVGATGDAISFACEDYAFHLPDIEEYIGRKVPADRIPDDHLATLKPPVKVERKSRPGGNRSGPGGNRSGGRGGRGGGGGQRRGGGGRRHGKPASKA